MQLSRCLLVLFCLYCGGALADYDHGMRYAFVASTEKKSISIIDLHDQRLAETIQLQQTPGEIVASDRLDTLVIAYPAAKQLGLVDLSSRKLEQGIYALDLTPGYVKLDPSGDKLAVYDRSLAVLEIHQLQRRQVLARIDSVNTTVPLTFNRDGQYLFWVDTENGLLHSSDLQGQVTSLKLAANGAGLSAMTRSVDGSMGFISDALAGHVYVINLLRMELLKTVPAGNGPGRGWGTADGQTVLIPNQQSGTITAISTFTLEPLYTIETTTNPVAIYTGWLDTTAAVMDNSGEVILINLLSKKISRRLSLHGRPRAGVVTSDSRLLALPVSGNGDLFIFDMKSLTVKERIIKLPTDIGDASLAVSNNLCH